MHTALRLTTTVLPGHGVENEFQAERDSWKR